MGGEEQEGEKQGEAGRTEKEPGGPREQRPPAHPGELDPPRQCDFAPCPGAEAAGVEMTPTWMARQQREEAEAATA